MVKQLEVTKLLSRYVAETHYQDLPAKVIWEAKRRTADLLSIGLSASTTAVGNSIQSFARETSPAGTATLWGTSTTCTAELAALANATMTYHLELCDFHAMSHAHPAASIIPAALAICEERKLDVKAFLTAAVVGYEVLTRVGMGVSPSIYRDRVFLPPATLAPFGAATAVGKLYGLDEEEMAQVLGVTAFLSPMAIFEAYRQGTSIKEMAMGWGNLIGIWGVKLCSHGFVGPVTAIEGPFGYAKAASSTYNLDRVVTNLKSNQGIMNTTLKVYACCGQHHAAVDAILELREKYGLRPNDVVRIVDRTFTVATRGSYQRPHSIASAIYSAPFILASALATGSCSREEFTIDKINDPDLLDLAAKVEVVKDEELDALYDDKGWPAIVEVWTKDGRVLSSAQWNWPKGSPEHPISDAELKAKFTSLATTAISNSHAEELWQMIFAMENLRNMSELTALLHAQRS